MKRLKATLTAASPCVGAAYALSLLLLQSSALQARPSMLSEGFSQVYMATGARIKEAMIPPENVAKEIDKYCTEVSERFQHFGWDKEPCAGISWHAAVRSRGGKPLLFAEFGKGEEITLILSGVHPDELTPIPLIFRFAKYLSQNPEIYVGKDVKIVIAPLVNPDGFFLQTPTRTNSSGVDLNRNFYTADWYSRAKKFWVEWRKSQPTHFPGHFPNSEIETLFQIMLLEKYNPDKIVSVHAPLGFLDYDGPGDGVQRQLTEIERRAKRLPLEISAKSNNYKVVDYSFYPGSLGNFAGNERRIPTITLELESTSPGKDAAYWKTFLPGLIQSVQYPFQRDRLSRGPGGLFFLGEFLEDPGVALKRKAM